MICVLGSEWHLSSTGNEIITENGNIKDKQKILNSALNTDLKEICSPVLANELSKERTSKLVLQIQKIRNVSAPKANEESQAAPRMLKLSLTDGDIYVQALEISTINGISRNATPPGTKVLVNNAKIISGYILLTPSNCTLLGGRVPLLVEKWEVAKSVQRGHHRNSNDDGPPPWVNFGTKIQSSNQDGSFRSLGNKNSDGTKEDSEFELQRQGAIAEASSGAVKKVFGGRVKQNIQPVMNSQNRNFENNRDNRKEHVRNKTKTVQRDLEVEDKPLKPTDKVSLFAFLEDKLPVNDNQNTAKSTNYQGNSNNSFDFNESSSRNTNKPDSKPYYNNPQKGFQNHNRQNIYEDQSAQKISNRNYVPRQYDKPQYNDYQRQQYDRYNSSQNTFSRHIEHKRNESQFTNNASNNFEKVHYQQKHNENKAASNISNTFVKPFGKAYNQQKQNENEAAAATSDTNEKPFVKSSRQHGNADSSTSSNKLLQQKNENQANSTTGYSGNFEDPYKKSQAQHRNEYQSANNSTESSNFVKPYGNQPSDQLNNTTNSSCEQTQHYQQVSGDKTATQNITNSEKDVNDATQNLDKMTLNSQFASRSLRQHLNLALPKRNEDPGRKHKDAAQSPAWNIGDECMAKYWEDGKFYNATVKAISDKTFVVQFKGYGNIEEILKTDCLPEFSGNKQNYYDQHNRRYDQSSRPHSGSMEFRRSSRNFK